MNPVGMALWYVETHFSGELSLDQIAHQTGVSRFHLCRAFGAATGLSLMRYVRARRLSQAARTLSQGAPDILALALEVGYGSHEAFSRAFRDQFGVTPEQLRSQGHCHNIQLMEAIMLDQTPLPQLDPPRTVDGQALRLAGLAQHYTCLTSAGIPAQWQRFLPHLGHISGQLNGVAYGVCYNHQEGGTFDYLCGLELSDFSAIPADWSRLDIAEQRYAVFLHRQHISEIRRSWNTIWSDWRPPAGEEVVEAPFFERYGETFDPHSGLGGVELWVPIRELKLHR